MQVRRQPEAQRWTPQARLILLAALALIAVSAGQVAYRAARHRMKMARSHDSHARRRVD